MSLTVDITPTQSPIPSDAEARVNRKLVAINTRAGRQLLGVARRVVHVRTGRLRDGIVASGPFNISSGALELTISAPSVPYAKYEIARGGDHDFIARTFAEGQGVIEQAAQDMEAAIIDVMQGRA